MNIPHLPVLSFRLLHSKLARTDLTQRPHHFHQRRVIWIGFLETFGIVGCLDDECLEGRSHSNNVSGDSGVDFQVEPGIIWSMIFKIGSASNNVQLAFFGIQLSH